MGATNAEVSIRGDEKEDSRRGVVDEVRDETGNHAEIPAGKVIEVDHQADLCGHCDDAINEIKHSQAQQKHSVEMRFL